MTQLFSQLCEYADIVLIFPIHIVDFLFMRYMTIRRMVGPFRPYS